jgi:hypothetical protein
MKTQMLMAVDEAVLVLLELAEQSIDDTVSIRLNDRAVDGLSPGQRSSAMLPLIVLAEKGAVDHRPARRQPLQRDGR